MGTWDVDSFGNDDAADWAQSLDGCTDLSRLTLAIEAVLDSAEDYLDAPVATEAIAAIETLARLQGNWGERSTYSEPVDVWVELVKLPVPPALARQAIEALDRITGPDSELRDLWAESEESGTWLASVAELRGRIRLS
jgi:hypothetical protein